MPSVPIEIATLDAALIARLAGPDGALPGAVHVVNSGALLEYVGPSGTGDEGAGPAHEFRLEFGTPNVAAAAANWLWSSIHGHAAALRVAGEEVPIHHGAIKAALLLAAGEQLPV
jgi:hypothetical protein